MRQAVWSFLAGIRIVSCSLLIATAGGPYYCSYPITYTEATSCDTCVATSVTVPIE